MSVADKIIKHQNSPDVNNCESSANMRGKHVPIKSLAPEFQSVPQITRKQRYQLACSHLIWSRELHVIADTRYYQRLLLSGIESFSLLCSHGRPLVAYSLRSRTFFLVGCFVLVADAVLKLLLNCAKYCGFVE